jgi:hypothetical protein
MRRSEERQGVLGTGSAGEMGAARARIPPANHRPRAAPRDSEARRRQQQQQQQQQQPGCEDVIPNPRSAGPMRVGCDGAAAHRRGRERSRRGAETRSGDPRGGGRRRARETPSAGGRERASERRGWREGAGSGRQAVVVRCEVWRGEGRKREGGREVGWSQPRLRVHATDQTDRPSERIGAQSWSCSCVGRRVRPRLATGSVLHDQGNRGFLLFTVHAMAYWHGRRVVSRAGLFSLFVI